MADVMRTANYGQEDTATTITMYAERLTTTELTALSTARRVGINKLYYDTTVGGYKLGVDHRTISGVLTLAGLANAIAITGGTINGTSVGATARSTGAFTTLSMTSADSTGTPGNVTNNNANGRAAFAAGGTTVVVTCSAVAAADQVHVTLLGAADATLKSIAGVTVAAGSFTVIADVAATATKGFMYTVVKV
jgi:hypothetical protein